MGTRARLWIQKCATYPETLETIPKKLLVLGTMSINLQRHSDELLTLQRDMTTYLTNHRDFKEKWLASPGTADVSCLSPGRFGSDPLRLSLKILRGRPGGLASLVT